MHEKPVYYRAEAAGIFYAKVYPYDANQWTDQPYTISASICNEYLPYGGEEFGWGYFPGKINASSPISVR